MNFGKTFLVVSILSLFFGFALPKAVADGVAFTQVAPPNDPDPDLIGRLKYQAVVDYLQRSLGPRYPEFEKHITREFAEEYILEFSKGRSAANRAQIEVTGKINSDGLKRWMRVMEAKANKGSSSSGTIFLVSSAVPGLTLAGYDTAARVRDNPVAREMLTLLSNATNKYNLRLETRDLRLSLSQPARNDDELRSLRDSVGPGKVLWVHFAPCKTCGGIRMDMYFYNLQQGRALIQRTEEIAIDPREMTNAGRLAKTLKTPLSQFQGEMDDLVSSGMISSAVFHIIVEGVESYKSYKLLETELGQLDFIAQAILSRAESRTADFEVNTAVPADELLRRLGTSDFPGFRLKPLRVDSRGVIVRYSKQQG